MIKIGDRVPDVSLYELRDGQPAAVSAAEVFGGKKVVLFALPGAFTPTCSGRHLPGFVEHAEALRGKGVDDIVCVSVNDAWVMDAWGKAQSAGRIRMLGDGNAEFSSAVGLTMDGSGRGLGTRSQRYAMVVNDGVVTALEVEAPGACEVSTADSLLALL